MAKDESWLVSQERAGTLLEGTRERAVAEFAMRLRWHGLFDPCPRVLALCPPDGADVFRRFLAWADRAKSKMDWSLHLELLVWLSRDPTHRDALDEDMILELLAAAASKWAIYDRGPNKGIVLGCQRTPCTLVVGWKCLSTERGRTVALAATSEPATEDLETLVGYFEVAGASLDSLAPWLPFAASSD
ncbi:hypothetical protein LVJ94_36845 [Pendulispora rubella]|uniref:Uncharacterized protein n=1 Tax=Pendulispora rubella TaxID=2741070 RepID=A0ABZ2KXJ0_9BACT